MVAFLSSYHSSDSILLLLDSLSMRILFLSRYLPRSRGRRRRSRSPLPHRVLGLTQCNLIFTCFPMGTSCVDSSSVSLFAYVSLAFGLGIMFLNCLSVSTILNHSCSPLVEFFWAVFNFLLYNANCLPSFIMTAPS